MRENLDMEILIEIRGMVGEIRGQLSEMTKSQSLLSEKTQELIEKVAKLQATQEAYNHRLAKNEEKIEYHDRYISERIGAEKRTILIASVAGGVAAALIQAIIEIWRRA